MTTTQKSSADAKGTEARAPGAAAASRGAIAAGLAAGFAAALLFGVSAPLAKRLLADTGPLWLAGLLYLGAGLGLAVLRTMARRWLGRGAEAPLRRQDAGLLLSITLLGGALGPVLMLLGLARVGGVAGALLLNLEGPLTILLAVLLFGEHLGGRAGTAALCIFAGALALTVPAGGAASAIGAGATAAWLGGVALAGACLCWALDNNLTQRLSLRDPWAIAMVKTLGAGSCNVVLAVASGQVPPGGKVAALTMAVGLGSYGISLILDTYALRLLGAAREATIFSTAPFVGALAAVPLLGERLGIREGVAFALMAGGVVLLARDRHAHPHLHEAMEHEHSHVHDEHHQHQHAPDAPPGEPHVHLHRHAPLAHDHPHVSDLHHRHRH